MEEAQKLKTNESDTKLKGDSGRRLPEGTFYISLLRVVSTMSESLSEVQSLESDLLKIVFRFRLRFEWRLGYLLLLLPTQTTNCLFFQSAERKTKATFVSLERTLPSLNRKKMLDFSQSTSISDNLTEVEEIENFSEESSRLRLSF